MSHSIGSEQSMVNLICKDSSAALAETLATLSVDGTNEDSSCFRAFNFPKAPSGVPASTSLFGSSSGVSDVSIYPLFGGSSTPASGASSYPLFGETCIPASGFSRPTLFGASSIPTFGASRSPLFGAPNTAVSGASNSPLFGVPNTPESGASSSPLFGTSNTLTFGASTTPLFGPSNSLASGASNSPLFGAYNTPASGTCSSLLFGASSTPVSAASNSALVGASISPLFSTPSKPAFGASNSPLFDTFSTPLFGGSRNPFVVHAKPIFTSCSSKFGASSNPGCATCGSSSNLAYNTSNLPFNTSTPFPLQQSNSPAFSAFGSPFGASSTPPLTAFTGATSQELVFSPNNYNSPFGGFGTRPFEGRSGRGFGMSSSSFDGFKTTTPKFGSSTKPAFSLCNSPFGDFEAPSPSFGGFGTTTPGFGINTKGVSCRYYGAPNSSYRGCSSHLPNGFTSWSPFWKDPVRLSSFSFAPAKLGCRTGGRTAVAYKPLYNYEDENQFIVYMSISAILANKNIDMSHEELRWIEYSPRCDKGACNKSADTFQIKSTNTESDMISIKIEIPSRIATELLDAFMSLHIDVDSCCTCDWIAAPTSTNPMETKFSQSERMRRIRKFRLRKLKYKISTAYPLGF